jgi:hypothetical protein
MSFAITFARVESIGFQFGQELRKSGEPLPDFEYGTGDSLAAKKFGELDLRWAPAFSGWSLWQSFITSARNGWSFDDYSRHYRLCPPGPVT